MKAYTVEEIKKIYPSDLIDRVLLECGKAIDVTADAMCKSDGTVIGVKTYPHRYPEGSEGDDWCERCDQGPFGIRVIVMDLDTEGVRETLLSVAKLCGCDRAGQNIKNGHGTRIIDISGGGVDICADIDITVYTIDEFKEACRNHLEEIIDDAKMMIGIMPKWLKSTENDIVSAAEEMTVESEAVKDHGLETI